MQDQSPQASQIKHRDDHVDRLVTELDHSSAGGRVVRGGLLRTGFYLVGVLLSVFSSRLMFEHLGVADSGRYVTVVALIGILVGITDAGLTSIGVREYASTSAEERKSLIANIAGLRIVLGLLGALVAVLFVLVGNALAPDRYSDAMLVGTALAAIGLFLANLQGTFYIPLQALLMNGRLSFFDLLKQVINVLVVVICVVFGFGLTEILAGSLVSGVVVLAVLIPVAMRYMPLKPMFSLRVWRSIFAAVAAVTAATALSILYYRLAMVIVSLLASEQETGYFAASFRVYEVILIVPLMMVSTALPVLARSATNDFARFQMVIERILHGSLVAGVGLSVTLFVGADFVIDVVAGDKFSQGAETLAIQAPVMTLIFIATALGAILISLHMHRVLLLSNLLLVVFIATGCVLVVGPFGINGVAVVMLTAELLLVLTYLFGLRKTGAVRFNPSLVLRIILAGLLSVFAGLILPLPSVLQAGCSALIYLLLLAALRLLPAEINAFIPGFARGDR